MDKNELRRKFLEIRKNVNEKDKKSKCIASKVLDLKILQKSQIIGIYSSISDEVDTSIMSKKLIEMGKTICFPKTIKNEGLQFFKVSQLNDLIETGVFEIKEPIYNSTNLITNNQIDLMIMPGICFDKKRNRIGFGKGYYDKYLKKSQCYKIAICFHEQILDDNYINPTVYDIRPDIIISDKEIIV